MKALRSILVILALVCALAGPAARAQTSDLVGHWDGAIELPGTRLVVDLDFSRDGGTLAGDISIPVQGARDLALIALALDGRRATFEISGVGGKPTFAGELSADGQSIAGTFTQGGGSFPFALQRTASPVSLAKERLGDLEEQVGQMIAAWEVPGLALAVVKDGEVILARGFGFRDLDAKLPVTADTLFAIGSASKAFTTLALGLMVEDGKLDWDRPVADQLPGFKLDDGHASALLTPRDLVTHRSGLPRHDLTWYNNQELPRSELVARLAHLPANEPFRARFQYNNLMFLTAGYLIEHASGKSWEETVRERIFTPLGMSSSNFAVEDSQRAADFAQPYEEREHKLTQVPFRSIGNMGPAGSINSSAADMARWVQLQLSGGRVGERQLASVATITAMHTPQMPLGDTPERPDISSTSYGLGWFIETYRGHRHVSHGGNIDGFSALVSLFPDEGLGFVVLANKGGTGLPGLVARHAADRLLGLEPVDWNGDALRLKAQGDAAESAAKAKKTSVRKPGTKPAHPLADYAGTYHHPGYGDLAVAVAGERLALTFNKIGAALEHWHYEVWNAAEGADDPTFENLKFLFETDFRGNVGAVSTQFEPAAGEIRFTKKPDARLSDPAYLARFVGDYNLAGQSLRIDLMGSTLLLTAPGGAPAHLVPALGDEFSLEEATIITVRFELDQAGKVKALSIQQPDGVFTATRTP